MVSVIEIITILVFDNQYQRAKSWVVSERSTIDNTGLDMKKIYIF